MSELRWHPFHQEWVITATHRQDRTFFPPEDYCPFCPTKETPTEIPRETYDIAVLENKFPSLSANPPTPSTDGSVLMPVLKSEGVCEVVCYSPEHNTTLADLPLMQIRKLVRVWQDRYAELSNRPEVKYVHIFENKGREIGVTLTHPHGQIYAYPFIPDVIQTRLKAEREHFEKTGRQLAQDWLDEEIKNGRRIVAEWEDWVAIVPFFARYPFEVSIVPRAPKQDLANLTEKDLDGMARALKNITKKLDNLFGFSMPYIMSIFEYPAEFSRLIIEFTPPYRTKDKLKYLAGSEASCGIFINDTLPEETAALLRAIANT